MGHVWIEDQRLAFVEPLLCVGRIHLDLAPQTVNDHVARSPVLGQLASHLECEEH